MHRFPQLGDALTGNRGANERGRATVRRRLQELSGLAQALALIETGVDFNERLVAFVMRRRHPNPIANVHVIVGRQAQLKVLAQIRRESIICTF